MSPRISVVMTSYNGEKYIIEQLESIRKQTMQPDEVTIYDDGSTDNTIELVQNYLAEFSLDNWTMIQNPVNLGWRKNFIQGFQRASGEIVFSADQDDIWESYKIERMAGVLNEHPEIEVLACNIAPFCDGISSDRAEAPYYTSDYGGEALVQVAFDHLWLEPRRQGCCMAFRKAIMNSITKIWFDTCAHDLALWAYGVARGSLYILNEKLIQFRRHTGNNTPSNQKTSKIRSGIVSYDIELTEKFLKHSEEFKISDENAEMIRRLNRFYKKRYKAITTKNVFTFASLLGDIRLYTKPAAWVGDVISAFR